jgi:D-alanyl-D-alanine carboxypeptidase
VTTRQETRARRSVRATFLAAAAVALTVAGAPGQAQAAMPAVAQTWSSLMYRSLSAAPQATEFRSRLTDQQTAFTATATGLTWAKRANFAAQTVLTAATAADVTARARQTAAGSALVSAKRTLARVSKQKPRSNAAIARAGTAVTVATRGLTTAKTLTQQSATALAGAGAGAATATAGLTSAIVAWRTASVAVRQTQAKIAGLGNPTALAGQAAALSRDVVTQVRAKFTIADTTAVYGVTVNKTIAYAFQRMVDDAKADGIVISGGGFRTTQRQIELRTINGCPDVWTAPSSSCRVPTAIPGRSLHELGLAVDISSGGKTITRKSPAYAWLATNADEYGFINLPSEAWHWSITGS